MYSHPRYCSDKPVLFSNVCAVITLVEMFIVQINDNLSHLKAKVYCKGLLK